MDQQAIRKLFDDSVKINFTELDLALSFNRPSAHEFNALRKDAGWNEVDIQLAALSLRHSLFHIGVYRNEELIAYGRVIGDGALFYYVQDVVVIKPFQGKGLGGLIMQGVESFLDSTTCKGATAGLLSVIGKEDFYQRYGYKARDGIALGLGMCKFY
ncbi:GNAT family N-acetyltransferase [Shewanella olleyana]|uniref:GNAT family N-acetyltransferase n=1 Tax=Shewanella olleyana TaxID=135626 RepID=UPI00200C269D|nr:GNAT family N-acetyltransferase [Shewanella olleyana]MCL1068352.1 GNAT family N-acetyltransferase [Shewanella olleyana]